MDIFKINSSICDYYSETKEDEAGANIIVGWCHDNGCECSEVPFDECITKAIEYCKLKDRQLKQLKMDNKNLKNNNVFSIRYFKDKCDKYYATLTQIKKILLFNKKELEECLHNDIDGQILKIIDEVQDVENN